MIKVVGKPLPAPQGEYVTTTSDFMNQFQWTRIDPAVHTPEFFRGKGVTWLLKRETYWDFDEKKYGAHCFGHVIPCSAEYFLLHPERPPFPDPLEEEIEKYATAYCEDPSRYFVTVDDRPGAYGIAKRAYVAGAKAFLGRGK